MMKKFVYTFLLFFAFIILSLLFSSFYHNLRNKALGFMEERRLNPVPETINLNHNQNPNPGVVKYVRDAPPSHYSIKIQYFSSLLNVLPVNQPYSSESFDASGYKWRLILYPNGNSGRGGEGHLSLYLAIDETETLPLGWEVYVTFKVFIFDHFKDKYLTIQDDLQHQVRRFHKAKKEWGFHKLISLEIFKNSSNGYLVDNSCVLGTEVFQVTYSGKSERLKMVKSPNFITYSWRIPNFSEIKHRVFSDEFTGGKYKWRLLLYPEGDFGAGKRSLSLFIDFAKCPSRAKKVLAEYWLVIKSQTSTNDMKKPGKHWFTLSKHAWGIRDFISLSELKNESNGYIFNDVMIVEAEVKIICKVNDFS